MMKKILAAAQCSFVLLSVTLPIDSSVSAVAAQKSSGATAGHQVSDTYILGPGDRIRVELFQIPDLSGTFSIGPDGSVYLPRLRALYVEGLTLEELRLFLVDQYSNYVKDPQVYVNIASYRPVRVYVGGEISRPGFYTLSKGVAVGSAPLDNTTMIGKYTPLINNPEQPDIGNAVSDPGRWPTLFDALRAGNGVTPFSDLSKVTVTRKQSLSNGYGKIRATVDFLQLVSNGDESVNIRIFDGDVIKVSRSPVVLRDQLLQASRTNLSPDYVVVFVSGRVQEPGPVELRQGATLNQAIAAAGGPKLLRGSVEFLRFNPDGTSDRRRFSYKDDAPANDSKNPVLMAGDIVRVNDSILSASVGVLNEITGPAVGIYSVYSLFKP